MEEISIGGGASIAAGGIWRERCLEADRRFFLFVSRLAPRLLEDLDRERDFRFLVFNLAGLLCFLPDL
jgi:hypothetical protein